MSNSTPPACAACKYQRRKCSPDCPLAPYFPASQPKQFLNVHRLFGVSNVLRILRQVNPSMKADTVKSIVYEADAWERDPVYGCWGLVSLLQNQVDSLQAALDHVRNQIFLLKQCSNQTNRDHSSWNPINPDAVNLSFPSAQRGFISMNQASDYRSSNTTGSWANCVNSVASRADGLALLDLNGGSQDGKQLHSFNGIAEHSSSADGDRGTSNAYEFPD